MKKNILSSRWGFQDTGTRHPASWQAYYKQKSAWLARALTYNKVALKFLFLNIYLYICAKDYGRVAKLVDATDLKSVVQQWAWGFDSPLGYSMFFIVSRFFKLVIVCGIYLWVGSTFLFWWPHASFPASVAPHCKDNKKDLKMQMI